MKRVESIDIARGIVMVIMVLDHVRDLLHTTAIAQSPTDLSTTTTVLFFTRWITYLCAPIFVCLSGVSAFIAFAHKNDVAASRSFLWKRGLWLIVLEFTLVTFGVWFDVRFDVLMFGVIAAIGFGFIVLGLLLKLPTKTIGIIGLAIVFCHNLVPLLPLAETSGVRQLLSPLFAPGAFPFGSGRTFVMGYPPIPWLGIMLVGFASGRWFLLPPAERKGLFLKIGLAALALFVLLRFINVYGDPVAWTSQKNGWFTFLSFINLTKYPPSLLFCLLFLGMMYVMLAALEGVRNRFTDLFIVYGRVPLFYFLVHWYIIHPLMFAMVFLQGYGFADLQFGFNFGRPAEGSGIELWAIYLVWIAVVAALYPLCRWYGQYKERHRERWWLGYL